VTENPWVWLKKGKHLEEGHALCQQCAREAGEDYVREVEVRFVEGPTGEGWTFIYADGPWWREQMRVHPNDWKGGPIEEVADRLFRKK
jgi:hypothetical protein